MKYTKFEPWMVGQRIYWPGDYNFSSTFGTVIGRRDYIDEYSLWALWDNDGKHAHIKLSSVDFPNMGDHTHSFTNTQNMQEIIIDGKRYKLTLIEG